MKTFPVTSVLLGAACVNSFRAPIKNANYRSLHMSENANTDLFGGTSSSVMDKPATVTDSESKVFVAREQLKDKAARLRQEAAEMEVALREEARMKGVPEEMINKLVPIRPQTPTPAPAATSTESPTTATTTSEVALKKDDDIWPKSKMLEKLSQLSTGNPVKFSTELNVLQRRSQIKVWNSVDLGKPNFNVNSFQLTSRTNIDPINLKLDDVGFDYQKVLVIVVISATLLAFGSSFIGGQIGFILGYASALIPVTLLGVGSITPALIGDVINSLNFLIDQEAREKYITFHAGRFLAGYALGLPIAKFSKSGPTNIAEFFQIRPEASKEDGTAQQFFSKSKYSQYDIAPYSIVCLAGSVAECIEHSKAKGYSANDVNTLNELMLAVEPAMTPENAQSHIKWAAIQSFNIISKYPNEFKALREAFARGASLEECITIVEGAK